MQYLTEALIFENNNRILRFFFKLFSIGVNLPDLARRHFVNRC